MNLAKFAVIAASTSALAGFSSEACAEPRAYASASATAISAKDRACESNSQCARNARAKGLYGGKLVSSASAQASSNWDIGVMTQELRAKAKRYQAQGFQAAATAVASLGDLNWRIDIPGANDETVTSISFRLTIDGALAGDTPEGDRMSALLYIRDTRDSNHWGQLAHNWDGTNSYSEGPIGFAAHSFIENGPRGLILEGTFEVRGTVSVLDVFAQLNTELWYGDFEHFGSGAASHTAKFEIIPHLGSIVSR